MTILSQIKKNTKTYTDEHQAFRGLLGGIGTGNISLDGAGRMCDFEIMNQPNKNQKIPSTFFAMWSQFEGEDGKAVILEAKPRGISNKALGHPSGELLGLPRMDDSSVETKYPFYLYKFKKDGLPLAVELEAYTPFIPLNSKDSGMPTFSMKYTVTNQSDKVAKVAISETFYNFTGYKEYDGNEKLSVDGIRFNKGFEEDGLTGILLGTDVSKEALNYGTMTIATANTNVSMKPYWDDGVWWDGAEEFWRDFSSDGILNPDIDKNRSKLLVGDNEQFARSVASLSAKETIAPGETKEYTFYISWHFPNRLGWWPDGWAVATSAKPPTKVLQNFYSVQWKDAKDVLTYFHNNRERLHQDSSSFASALYGSTIGADVVESLVSSITVLRSNTCFRIADGKFFGWEGCGDTEGSCKGTCTHVWNYAQTMAFLFPELEISARRIEYLHETNDEGKMNFRTQSLLDDKPWDMFPAADGQLGCILRTYREWKLTGDDDFLKEVWDKLCLTLEYALKTWDLDGDFVLDARQHNTYDIEFYGVSSLTNVLLYAALKAAAQMARYLGEEDKAKAWEEGAKIGSAKMDKELWNGEYYKQSITPELLAEHRYQYGDGCLADQILGQGLGQIYGLGYVLPQEHVKKINRSIYRYNYREDMDGHESVQRGFAYPDEGGLTLCSWPHGGRPAQPFVYSDEVWTGIEYQMATQLIYQGDIDEAMNIVKSIRHRYNGERRSPYNEIECGNHYARSMAAWGMLVAISGYTFDLPNDKIGFNPVVSADDFKCFYSNGKSWGTYEQEKQADGTLIRKIKPLYGSLDGIKVNDGECEIIE